MTITIIEKNILLEIVKKDFDRIAGRTLSIHSGYLLRDNFFPDWVFLNNESMRGLLLSWAI